MRLRLLHLMGVQLEAHLPRAIVAASIAGLWSYLLDRARSFDSHGKLASEWWITIV